MLIAPDVGPLAGNRWTAFDTMLQLEGVDLTDAVMEMHVRLMPDAPGAPLVDLDTVTTTNTQGLRLVSVETVDGVKVSTVQIRINETTMEGLPAADEVGSDAVFSWDMLIHPSAALNPALPAIKQKYLQGTLNVRAGSTQ